MGLRISFQIFGTRQNEYRISYQLRVGHKVELSLDALAAGFPGFDAQIERQSGFACAFSRPD